MTITFFDIIACALLAAASAYRARVLGANVMGAFILGCICGLLAPITRELFLHGSGGVRLVLLNNPNLAFAGAFSGIILQMICHKWSYKIFVLLDSLSIGLASCLAAYLGISTVGITGTLVLGLLCGLGPGLLRDMALGDTAMMIEKNWYAAAAAIGIMLTILLLQCLPENNPSGLSIAVLSIIPGCILVIILRFLKNFEQYE